MMGWFGRMIAASIALIATPVWPHGGCMEGDLSRNSPLAIHLPLPEFEPCFLKRVPHRFLIESIYPGDAYNYDALPGGKLACKGEEECARVHCRVERLTHLSAWKSFLVLNWPVDTLPRPKLALGDSDFFSGERPWWLGWYDAEQVFRYDGSPPDTLGKAARLWPLSFVRSATGSRLPEMPRPPVRLLSHTDHKAFHGTLGSQRRSADKGGRPILVDQGGNPVFFETFMNRSQLEFIMAGRLYSIRRQSDYLDSLRAACSLNSCFPDFSIGRWIPQDSALRPGNQYAGGPVELKAAWKILGPEDKADRFIHAPALVPCDSGKSKGCKSGMQSRTVGLVGLHILQRTNSSTAWLYHTFEHADNLDVEIPERNRQPELKPSFRAERRSVLPANHFDTSESLRPTQVRRTLPIAGDAEYVNGQVRSFLRGKGSVLANYRLIGSQFSLKNPSFKTPKAVRAFLKDPDSGGDGTFPRHLANVTLETFAPAGNAWIGGKHVFQAPSCIHCHAKAGFVRLDSLDSLGYRPDTATAGFTFIYEMFARMTAEPRPHTLREFQDGFRSWRSTGSFMKLGALLPEGCRGQGLKEVERERRYVSLGRSAGCAIVVEKDSVRITRFAL